MKSVVGVELRNLQAIPHRHAPNTVGAKPISPEAGSWLVGSGDCAETIDQGVSKQAGKQLA